METEEGGGEGWGKRQKTVLEQQLKERKKEGRKEGGKEGRREGRQAGRQAGPFLLSCPGPDVFVLQSHRITLQD